MHLLIHPLRVLLVHLIHLLISQKLLLLLLLLTQVALEDSVRVVHVSRMEMTRWIIRIIRIEGTIGVVGVINVKWDR